MIDIQTKPAKEEMPAVELLVWGLKLVPMMELQIKNVLITKTCLLKYTENFTTNKMKIFR